MFHVRRRPADCAPRKRKKKPGALGTNTTNPRDVRDAVPLLVELGPDGSAPHPGDTARTIRLTNDVMEVSIFLFRIVKFENICKLSLNFIEGSVNTTLKLSTNFQVVWGQIDFILFVHNNTDSYFLFL